MLGALPDPRTEEKIVAEELRVVSPYELSPSDNPRTAITPVQFTGDNYAEWTSKLENALRAKRKSGFINGTLIQPVGKPREFEVWNTVNSMIVGWIRASISPKIRSTVTFTSDAHKLWSDLLKRYSIGNGVRIHQLKAELASCRQDGMSVMDYFGKFSSRWEELLNYKPLPRCTCDWRANFLWDYEEERVHQFLMGLDEARLGNVVTSIIGLEPLPELNMVYQKVVLEERRLSASRGDVKQDVIAFSAATQENSRSAESSAVTAAATRAGSVVVCSHCGRNGHEKKDCWQLVGFPDWWLERNQNREKGGRGNSSRGRGGYSSSRRCGGYSQHPPQQQPQYRSNAAQAPTQSGSFPSFTTEQWAALSQLIEQQKPPLVLDRLNGNNQTGEVILDTGASHHMTGDGRILTQLQPILPCPVSFADGSRVYATQCGSLTISAKITLTVYEDPDWSR